MPARTKKEAENKPATIFVPRERLAIIYSLRPPTDEQKAVLSAHKVHAWPHQQEFLKSEEILSVLFDIDIAWSDKK